MILIVCVTEVLGVNCLLRRYANIGVLLVADNLISEHDWLFE